MRTVHVFGGDYRSYHAAVELCDRGFEVILSGFPELLSCDRRIIKAAVDSKVRSDYMLLPVPYSTSDGFVRRPHEGGEIALATVLDTNETGAVFLGMCDDAAIWELKSRGLPYRDILRDTQFAAENAEITAQAAVLCVYERSDMAPSDTSVLITGAGRIGKRLSTLLTAMGADVTVSARSETDLDWLYQNGVNAVHTEDIEANIGRYDVVINTIPSLVLTPAAVRGMRRGSMAVELASYPHGISFDACAKHGVRSYLEMSLPGRYFPVSAGKAIARAFLRGTEAI